MADKSKLAIATSKTQNPIPFLIELLFNLLSQMITISTIKLTSQPVRPISLIIPTTILRWSILLTSIDIFSCFFIFTYYLELHFDFFS